jgi:hypothetical protein
MIRGDISTEFLLITEFPNCISVTLLSWFFLERALGTRYTNMCGTNNINLLYAHFNPKQVLGSPIIPN